jgi:hypothetical protein
MALAEHNVAVVTGTNPAANTEFSETVPTGQRWQLLAVTVSLAQGITQTPQPILVIDDGTTVLFESFGSSAAQAVSTTCRYTWAPGHPLTGQVGATTNVHSTGPLPRGLLLPAGYRVRSSTIGIGAATDYGAPTLFVVKF